MKIQYLGHSCFRIISSTGTAVICDPYKADMVGFAMPKLSCDVVTISHHHDDHDCVAEVAGNPALLEKEVAVAADDVAVQSFHCWHDDKQGQLRGENYVFCFLVDGLKVVHMGDVGELSQELAQKLHGCDVLMIPVGGTFTVDAKGAKWYVDAIQPKIVIPMHYGTPEHKFQIDGVQKFLQLFPKQLVHFQNSETLVLEDQPQDQRLVVLDKYED